MKRALVAGWVILGLAGALPAEEKLTLKEWDHLVSTLAAGQSPEVRAQWAATLVKQFAADKQAVAALPAEEFDLLSKLVAGLDAKQGSDLAAVRASDATILANAEVTELAALAAAAGKTNRAAAAKALAALEKNYQAAKNQFTWTDCMSVSRTFNGLADLPAAQKWGMRAYQGLLGTGKTPAEITEKQLIQLANFFREIKLNGKGKSYPEFAAALANLARQDNLSACDQNWHDACGLGWLLDVPQTRQVLQDEMTNPQGELRTPVGKIVCWAYVTADDDKLLDALLDARLADARLSGERRIPWLLLRAYAASLRGNPSPSYGKKWLDEVLQVSSSARQKLEIALLVAIDLADTDKHEDAMNYLNKVSEDLTGSEAGAALDEARRKIRQSKVEFVRDQRTSNIRMAEDMEAKVKRATEIGDEGTVKLFDMWAKTFRQRAAENAKLLESMATQPSKVMDGNAQLPVDGQP